MAVTRIDYANLDETLVGSEVVALSHGGEVPGLENIGTITGVTLKDGVVIVDLDGGKLQIGIGAGGYVEIA